VTAETLTPDGGRLALEPAQETALAALERGTLSDLTRAAYEETTGVSRSQAAYDLAELVRLGLLERVGAGRATRYRLARGVGGRGRQGNPAPARRAAAADLGRAARAYGSDRSHSLLAGAIVVLVVTLAGLLFLPDRDRRDLATPQARSVGAGSALDRAQVAEPALIETPATDARVALRLTAARASSWLAVRRGSADGRVLFEGILATGQSIRFQGKRLWLRLGAPVGLRARLDGRSLALPDRTSTILVREGGLRVLDVDTPAPSPPQAPAPVVVSQPVVYAPPTSEPSEAGATSSSPPPSPDESPSPDPPPPAGPDPDDPKSYGM
jgi:hypothetical protein